MVKRKKEKAEMVGGKRLSVNPTRIDSLPDELVFKILVRVPAQDVCDAARFVCRRWCRIIHTRNFIYAHSKHTTAGLIIQGEGERQISVTMRQGRNEISNFSYNFKHEVRASCDGLILELESGDGDTLYIANPATKQHFVLPPFPEGSPHPFPGMAYAAASMEYKVAALYGSWGMGGFSDVLGPEFAILTVGVDNSWRRVDTEHLSYITDGEQGWEDDPLITEGFMHWVIHDTHVLTLNVETEIVTEFPIPHQVYGQRGSRYYLSAGKCLSLLIGWKLKWEVWEIKPETGEWTKLPSINLEPQKCKFERCLHLTPIGWLKHQEVLIFDINYGRCRARVAYDVHTQEIHFLGLHFCSYIRKPVVHRSNLLWL